MKNINKHIKDGQFKNLYLLAGEEAYLLRSYRDKLKNAIIQEDAMNFQLFEGNKIDVSQVFEYADKMPFVADRRLVIIQDSGWFKSSQEFSDYLKTMPDSTLIIFVEKEIDKRNKLYKYVKENGYIANMDAMDERSLAIWVASYLQKANKKITEGTIHYLFDRVGQNMELLSCELEKLISYCYEKEVINKEDIASICT